MSVGLLSRSAYAYVWLASTPIQEVKFKLLQDPTIHDHADQVDDHYRLTDCSNSILDKWTGVKFSCPVLKLHIFVREQNGQARELLDNRQNDLEVQRFNPVEPIILKGDVVNISWEIDTNKHRLDLKEPNVRDILRPTHSYILGQPK